MITLSREALRIKIVVSILNVTALSATFGYSETINSSTWTQTEPGAGGAFVTISGGPTGIVLAGSDLGGAYCSTNGGAHWYNIGNTQGMGVLHTSAIGFHPTNQDTIFLGTDHTLYRSTNFTGAGTFSEVSSLDRYWTAVTLAKSRTSFGLGAGFPSYNSSTAIMYRTTDTGASWSPVDTIVNCRIQKIVIDPSQYETAYMLSQEDSFISSLNTTTRLYKTTDGGTTWTPFSSGPTGGVLDFDINPDTTSILYYSTASGTYKTTNSGSSWSSVSSNYGEVRCSTGSTVRIINIVSHYTYESTNGGSSWAQTASSSNFHNAFTPTFSYGKGYCYCKTVGNDLSNGDTYYWETKQWVYKTTDGGANWYPMYTDSSSINGSVFWRGRGISNVVPLDVTISEADHDKVYIGMADMGLWRSIDHGETWQSCNESAYTGDWKGKGGDVQTVVADPTRHGVVWCGMGSVYRAPADMKLLKSTSSGELGSWSLSNSGLPAGGSFIVGLSVSKSSPDSNRTLFVTANGSVYKSTDDGAHWVLKDSSGTVYETEVDPSDSNFVYAGGDDGFYRSTDAGETWASTGSSAMKFVKDIKVAPSNTTDVFAVCFGTSKGLYRSTDHGATWTNILSDDFSRGVAVDPTDEKVIYHASSRVWNAGGRIGNSTGVKRTTDGGSSWTQVNEGLQWSLAYVVAVDPVSPTNVFIGAPGNAYQKRIFPEPSSDAVIAQDKREIPKECKLFDNYPNPFNPSTVISYQLPDAGTRYTVSLKVYDMLGREVAVLEDGRQGSGYYKATFDGSRFSSGMYISKLTVAAENDPHKKASPLLLVKKMLLLK